MCDYPYIFVGRRPEHDFKIISHTLPWPHNRRVLEEARWVALDWWGNCYVEKFTGAVGHFRCHSQHGLYLLMVVQRGSEAPDRFAVLLDDEQYGAFRFNPFVAIRHGAFDCMWKVLGEQKERSWFRDWRTDGLSERSSTLPENVKRRYVAAQSRLAKGMSIIVPTQADGGSLKQEIEEFVHFVPPDTLRDINIFTFCNTSYENLDTYVPLLCGWYSRLPEQAFSQILDAFAETDEALRLSEKDPSVGLSKSNYSE
jgi:hypothetical protein